MLQSVVVSPLKIALAICLLSYPVLHESTTKIPRYELWAFSDSPEDTGDIVRAPLSVDLTNAY